MAITQEILEDKEIKAYVSDGWWDRLKKWHPKLTLRIAAPLSFARAMATDCDT